SQRRPARLDRGEAPSPKRDRALRLRPIQEAFGLLPPRLTARAPRTPRGARIFYRRLRTTRRTPLRRRLTLNVISSPSERSTAFRYEITWAMLTGAPCSTAFGSTTRSPAT